MPWNYIATLTGAGSIPSLLGAAVDAPSPEFPANVLVVWSASGGALDSFQYALPPSLVSPPAPVRVSTTPLRAAGTSSNAPSAAYADGRWFIFWRGYGADTNVYASAVDALNTTTRVASGATQDAPVVAYQQTADDIFVGYNGPNRTTAGQQLYFSILGSLGGTPAVTTPSTAMGTAFNSYYSPGVAPTPDGGIALLWKGWLQGGVQDNRLFYGTCANPEHGGTFTGSLLTYQGAPVTATDRPSLGTWVPAGGGPPVLVGVFPSEGQLWYLEGTCQDGAVSWNVKAPVPVETILAHASSSGGPVQLSDPVAVWATSPAFSETLFLVIGNRVSGSIQDPVYFVRYTGPGAG